MQVQRPCKGLPTEGTASCVRLNCTRARFHLAANSRLFAVAVYRFRATPVPTSLSEAEQTQTVAFSMRRCALHALVWRINVSSKRRSQATLETWFRRNRNARSSFSVPFHFYYPSIGNELNNNTVRRVNLHAQQLLSWSRGGKTDRFIMRVSHGNKYLFPLFRRREEPIDPMKNRRKKNTRYACSILDERIDNE